MTKFPKLFCFEIVDARTGKPIPNVVAFLTLFAREKNDYDVGPKVSDASGIVTFTYKDLEDAISAAQRMFLMDYKSPVADCSSMVELDILSLDQIWKMIAASKLYGPHESLYKISDDAQNTYLNSANSRYFPTKKRFEMAGCVEGIVLKVGLVELPQK